ncbi:hypothetical protein BC629DRAFT_1502565 [Irpex lacteus]|nr:hypothetical protein BC629DRAFT_1502565 [Irpex lacteus]
MDVDSSPQLSQHSTTSEAINGQLEQSRQAVRKDANLSVPLVPVSYFKKSLLPRLRMGLDADKVVDKLRDVGHITPKGRLKVFKQSPSQTPGTEDSVFKSFGKVTGYVATQARHLLRKAKTNTKHTAEFCCNPTMTPQSTNRHSTSKPDSYGVLVARTVCNTPKNAPHWDDIVVAGEKKKKDTIADVNDNNEKILWSLHHAMRETVQRRFMFGYTIEDEMMRLWFCSRSDIIVSEQFNFITDHPTFVYFLLSIMYAEPRELGYDPTISVKRQTGDKKTNVYKISVPRQPTPDDPSTTKEYLTHEVVANISAEAMRGRATRVWRGKEVGPDGKATGPNRVIKDCWIDADRTREGDILKNILDAAKKTGDHTQCDPRRESLVWESTLEPGGRAGNNGVLPDTESQSRRRLDSLTC